MLGDPDRPVEAQDIFRANRLMFISSGLVLAVGICIGIEFALDRTSLSHVLLYVVMAAAVAVPVVFGFILLRRNNLTEGQNHS